MKKLFLFLFVIFLFEPVFAAEINMSDLASSAISGSENIVNEMDVSGFGTAYFHDKLKDSKDAFIDNKYEDVLDIAEEISDRRNKAFEINDSISVLKARLIELNTKGLETSKAEDLLNLSESVFKKEAFDDAEALLSKTENELDEISAKSTTLGFMVSSAKDNAISYIKEKWAFLLMLFLSSFILLGLAYFEWVLIVSRQKLEDMKLKKDVLENLVKESEKDYFERRKISQEEYDITAKNYKDSITDIKGKIAVLNSKVNRMNFSVRSIMDFYTHKPKESIDKKVTTIKRPIKKRRKK